MSEMVTKALTALGGAVATLIAGLLVWWARMRGHSLDHRSELTSDAMDDRDWYRKRLEEEREKRRELEAEMREFRDQVCGKLDRMQKEMNELWHDYHDLASTVRDRSDVDAEPHPKDPPSTLDESALPDPGVLE